MSCLMCRMKPSAFENKSGSATDIFITSVDIVSSGSVIGVRSHVFSDMPEGMIYEGYAEKPIKPRVTNK